MWTARGKGVGKDLGWVGRNGVRKGGQVSGGCSEGFLEGYTVEKNLERQSRISNVESRLETYEVVVFCGEREADPQRRRRLRIEGGFAIASGSE